ncbi:unnamed protein product [Bursaphelenchus xylophilus]|uniref:(pine wood nematode) hypothetical protein n=1 Tax=Bursaphelenchus xylophilus TaxID=6326 RepID=A0A7I8X2M5_BURXY|nr:unnamed protein product [Bursaphelenchus xylophilus]CAG9131004.1 unnamed protein product [Bursaphelenchus xylophilus]
MNLVQCLEEFVLYSSQVIRHSFGVFNVKPQHVCYFPSEFWDKCRIFIGRNEETGGLIGAFRASVLDYLVKDFFDSLDEILTHRRWRTILQSEVSLAADSHFFERMFIIRGLIEIRESRFMRFCEEDIGLETLQRTIIDDFLWKREIKDRLVIREIRKNIISDEKFQRVFSSIATNIFEEYSYEFGCSPCQRNEICRKHSFVFRKFKKLPHLVHRTILEKVHKSDILVLRTASEEGLCISDDCMVKRKVSIELDDKGRFKFVLNPFVSWRLGFDSKFISMHFTEAHIPLHLVEVELEGVKEFGEEIIRFINNNQVESLSYSLQSLSTRSSIWQKEVEDILWEINLYLDNMNNLNVVKFEKDARRRPKESWLLNGFRKEVTQYNIVFVRIE